MLSGGFKPAALERVARWATASPSPRHPWAGGLFGTVRRFWQEYGRDGAQVDVALGPPEVVDDARAAMHDYYAFIGMADRRVGGMLIRPTEIRDAIAGFADLGADEVMLSCHGLDPAEVDRLADIL